MRQHKGLSVQTPAKINWMLRVLRRREDGYHEIESLMSTVTLYDELNFIPRPDPGVSISCNHSNVPTDSRNLISQAAALLAGESVEMPDTGFHCELVKRIPVGGGAGGGSSDGAAALQALNQLWSLGFDRERLMQLAGRLGSDVPFFLYANTATVRGRGEQVQPVPLGWRGWIVLICPPQPVSTSQVYESWHPGDDASMPLAEMADFGAGCDAVRWMEQTYNALEAPAARVHPELGETLQRCTQMAGRPVRLSGSGSSMFTVFDTFAEAEVFADHVSVQLGMPRFIVEPTEQASQGR